VLLETLKKKGIKFFVLFIEKLSAFYRKPARCAMQINHDSRKGALACASVAVLFTLLTGVGLPLLIVSLKQGYTTVNLTVINYFVTDPSWCDDGSGRLVPCRNAGIVTDYVHDNQTHFCNVTLIERDPRSTSEVEMAVSGLYAINDTLSLISRDPDQNDKCVWWVEGLDQASVFLGLMTVVTFATWLLWYICCCATRKEDERAHALLVSEV
jgi:hypothetical protein